MLSLVALAPWVAIPADAPASSTVPGTVQGAVTTVDQVIALLEKSQTGHSMIEKAMRVWNLQSREEFEKRLKWGTSSRTDAVLIRHYDEETGKISRERQVTIYLRQNQSAEDLMLDLAHELVHATARPSWDPYDPNLTAGAYIRATIEGEGGEVEAVRVECQVSNEVFGEKSSSPSASRCLKYVTAEGASSGSSSDKSEVTQKIRQDFYRVGHWMGDLRRKLGDEKTLFPLLSGSRPALYSSTGGTPYPVALYEEYRQMTAVACENTRRRAPASSQSSLQDKSAQLLLSNRCKKEFLNKSSE
jgi:hypothetical protein